MIDPRAVVDPSAEIDSSAVVGAYAVIGANVRIGPGTHVAPHAMVQGPTLIGARNRIFQFASLGDAPQDKKYAGEPTRLEIGDDNVFRESCTINRGTTKDRGVTTVGNDNLFMAYSHVAHDCVVADHCVFANTATLGGHVEVGDWVIFAGFSGVHQFCKIGAHAFIGNNTAVTRDVPPYLMVTGRPAEPHSINSEGLKRRGFTPEQIRNLKNAFRLLYRSDLKLEEAAQRLAALVPEQPELKIFVDFLGTTTRSIVR
jgi:UDP-N-acetylglucosamine acyltransferase